MPLPRVSDLCGAHSRRTGDPCRNPAMENGRCRMHGGKSLVGIVAPRFTHGQSCAGLMDQLSGLGTAACYDALCEEPDRMERYRPQIEAGISMMGGDFLTRCVERDRERLKKAEGKPKVRLTRAERKARELERQNRPEEMRILPMPRERLGGVIPPYGESVRKFNR
jgi:hypothetical protein